MTQNELLQSVITDLGVNFVSTDEALLGVILGEVVNNALSISNRTNKDLEKSITLMQGEIRRCAKSLYLQRGAEDVNSQTASGLNAKYTDAYERLRNDIIKNGKRLLR